MLLWHFICRQIIRAKNRRAIRFGILFCLRLPYCNSNASVPDTTLVYEHVYWSKVLTDRFFRKHNIVKNLKTETIKQVIIHLSNLLKCFFFFFQKKSLCFFLVKKWKASYPNTRLLIISCIGHSRSHFLPLDLNGKKCWFASLWVLFVLRFISDNVFVKG